MDSLNPTYSKHRAYHAAEAIRIAGELVGLGPGFAEDGIVRTGLRERAEQESRRAELDHCDCGYCPGHSSLQY